MALDKAALLGQTFGIEDVEIEGIGTVRVRPLSRAEALEVRGKELPYDELERKLISAAMVEPALTADEVKEWQAVSPAGQLEVITDAIIRISGMEKAAQKAAYQQFRP